MAKSEAEKLAARRKRGRDYYWRHREECLERARKWKMAHQEQLKAYEQRRDKKLLRQKSKDYYYAHQEERIAYARKYREAHADAIKAYRLRPEVKERGRLRARKWIQQHREEARKRVRDWFAKHPAYRDYNAYMAREKLQRRMREDAQFYAEIRKKDRVRTAIKCIKEGRLYKPQMNRRIPDDYVKDDPRLKTMYSTTLFLKKVNGLYRQRTLGYLVCS